MITSIKQFIDQWDEIVLRLPETWVARVSEKLGYASDYLPVMISRVRSEYKDTVEVSTGDIVEVSPRKLRKLQRVINAGLSVVVEEERKLKQETERIQYAKTAN